MRIFKEGIAMVLVDHEIAKLAREDELIGGYDESCVTNIGYDLRTAYFAVDQKEVGTTSLMPGESVFVASREAIRLPKNLLGRVYLKNSRIRQGLSLEAPVYQPGHFTKVFFRLRNVSNSEITLKADEKYAMIVFEKLDAEPDNPYNGPFQSEVDFRGLADYKNLYKEQIKEIEQKKENLKDMERGIYANVLVILTVFVALFSFLTTNIGLFSKNATEVEFLIYNFITLGGIGFLVAMLQSIIGSKKRPYIWVATVLFFVIALVLHFTF